MTLTHTDGGADAVVAQMKAEAARRLATRWYVDLEPESVAGAVGLAPAQVKTVFPDRDSLLTALVLDAHHDMGESAERAAAEAANAGAGPLGRWVAGWEGVRGWALAHPEEYLLIWGRPVPDYDAPPETVEAAARTVLVLVALVLEALQAGELEVHREDEPALSEGMIRSVEPLSQGLLSGLPDPVIPRMMIMWTQLHGLVGFEVNDHLGGVAVDPAAYFTYTATVLGRYVGLTR